MNRGVIAPGNHLFRIRCAEHHPADHAAIFRYEKSRIMRLLWNIRIHYRSVIGGGMPPPYIGVAL